MVCGNKTKNSLFMLPWLLGKRYKKRWLKLDCGLFYLKDQDKVIETKLRFCVKERDTTFGICRNPWKYIKMSQLF